jgi:hypothetical protein
MGQRKGALFSFVSVVLLVFSGHLTAGTYSGGMGTAAEPYLIADTNDLLAISNSNGDYDKHFLLINDINFAEYEFNGAVIFGMRGFRLCPFAGIFNGNGHIIKNLSINTENGSRYYIGLFSQIEGSTAEIKNLIMQNISITAGEDCTYIGSLCGSNGNQYTVGGMITNCYVTGSVSGNNCTGGLCGENYQGKINNCYAACSITGYGVLGGLCGNNKGGSISNCGSIGEVNGKSSLGGLCGLNTGIISNSYSGCSIAGVAIGRCVGGLCGENREGEIHDCYSVFSINGRCYLGGACGYNSGEISNCNVVGSVTGECQFAGLCGFNSGNITNCYAEGAANGGDSSHEFGGLCGWNSNGTLTNCHSKVLVTGNYRSHEFGGFCGLNRDGNISGCYSTGCVTGGDYCRSLGGFCGENNQGNLINCYTTGSVTSGDEPSSIGGLCGINCDGKLNSCYAAGLVTSGYRHRGVNGGLCGFSRYDIITNCYFYVLSGSDNGFGIPLDDIQMEDASNFIGFDFLGNSNDGLEDCWTISEGHMPKLTWQTDEGPFIPDAWRTTLAGIGQSYDPFQINSYDDFMEFSANSRLNYGYYKLTTNIDLGSDFFASSVINRCFGGSFDGNGHVIRNVNIDTGGEECQYIGLFKMVCASLSNLGIEDVNITGINSSYVGGLCGSSREGSITNCYATGSINGQTNLGGLCGYNYKTSISDSYTNVSITGGDNSKLLGGLCGNNSYGVIKRSYSRGSVIGGINSFSIGGLCGNNTGNIANCYAVGTVVGDNYLGGLCGSTNENAITNSFWDVESSGVGLAGDDNFGAVGKTTAEMEAMETFTNVGWDFDWYDGDGADWFIQVGEYPILTWQISPADIYTDGRNNWKDFAVFAEFWQRDDCSVYNNYCDWADLDFSGDVGIDDLVELAAHWLAEGVWD